MVVGGREAEDATHSPLGYGRRLHFQSQNLLDSSAGFGSRRRRPRREHRADAFLLPQGEANHLQKNADADALRGVVGLDWQRDVPGRVSPK